MEKLNTADLLERLKKAKGKELALLSKALTSPFTPEELLKLQHRQQLAEERAAQQSATKGGTRPSSYHCAMSSDRHDST